MAVILSEDGTAILQESGGKILLETSTPVVLSAPQFQQTNYLGSVLFPPTSPLPPALPPSPPGGVQSQPYLGNVLFPPL
jgi:hypothetical protein